jgi:hypothetical protein
MQDLARKVHRIRNRDSSDEPYAYVIEAKVKPDRLPKVNFARKHRDAPPKRKPLEELKAEFELERRLNRWVLQAPGEEPSYFKKTKAKPKRSMSPT